MKQVINDYLGVSVSFNVIKADFGQPVRKSTSAVVLPKASSETALPISSTGNSNSIIGKENENLIHFVDHESELIDCNSCAEPRAYINSLRACSVRWR